MTLRAIINTSPLYLKNCNQEVPSKVFSVCGVSIAGDPYWRVDIELEGIIIVVGNYGSGKSEVSINLAIDRKQAGMDVQIADLDLVNPYFRIRETKDLLSKMGIHVVLPPDQLLQADLPILTPVVSGMIRNPRELTLLDVGGDDVGATVLAALQDSFRTITGPLHMLQVINPFRPFTGSVEGCEKIRQKIEKAAKMKVTGFIGNANLIEETTADHIIQGYTLCRALSKKSGLPLKFITIPSFIKSSVDFSQFSCPVLTINRKLMLPWTRVKTGGD